jgi:thiol-disulfide isomerase/thioredoxin
MNKHALVAPALAALLLAGCSSGTDDDAQAPTTSPVVESPVMEQSPSVMEETPEGMAETPEVIAAGGQYVPESQFRADPSAFEAGNTVLFFYAAWCPDCQQTDKSIQETGVPEDINIVKIDFDNANDLRKEYGVTQQHTFVLIGPGGEELKKWTGSPTAEDIATKAT